MNDVPISAFEEAILATHGAHSRPVGRVRVVEQFEGEAVWIGEVLVFELLDHAEADRCYCWEINGRVTSVLGVDPVDSPVKAVRASILAEMDQGHEG